MPIYISFLFTIIAKFGVFNYVYFILYKNIKIRKIRKCWTLQNWTIPYVIPNPLSHYPTFLQSFRNSPLQFATVTSIIYPLMNLEELSGIEDFEDLLSHKYQLKSFNSKINGSKSLLRDYKKPKG